MKQGTVILVGAGPGDPDLLTLKGKKAIESADVVVYDRLVSPAILHMIPDGAERINVGKEASPHTVPQPEINEILLQKALEGKTVVRLKGGDPFLFGRGGEELEKLAEQNVPFQEIPGITSAIAVPAYGGIPVTHRDHCSSVHIITGHQRAGKPLSIPFASLVACHGTLVFLMGVTALPQICAGLLKAGMDPETPAAIVEKGTTPAQRTVLATVGTLPAKAQNEQIQSPAVIVVGDVCQYHTRFDWFDHLPLKGQSVIVTRPKERAGTLSDRLRALGAAVTEFPCIETHPFIPCPDMEKAIEEIHSYEWLVFTSPAGVEALFAMLTRTGRDVRALGGTIKVAAIGPGTDRALQAHGLRADLIPTIYDAEHLGQALCDKHPTGRVLILRAQWGSPALTTALDRGTISYSDVACYETRYTCPQAEMVRSLLSQHPLITFTSASTVRGFACALGRNDFSGLTAVCIGKQTEAEAKAHGFSTLTAEKATLDALIQKMIEGALSHGTDLPAPPPAEQ